jgi:lipoprotein-releasing system ATP-binding protein
VLLHARGVHKSYALGRTRLHVLRGVDLDVAAGQFVAVVGASGCGKSTLLHLLGALDTPDAGTVAFDGIHLSVASADTVERIRNRRIGFVFQFYHLLAEMDVLENVLLPTTIDHSNWTWQRRQKLLADRAREMLDLVGLGARLNHKPNELSGGERQRVAIARALVNRPDALLADEPTGNLDAKTGGKILALLERLSAEHGQTIVMVTHDPAVAGRAHQTIRLVEGRIQ